MLDAFKTITRPGDRGMTWSDWGWAAAGLLFGGFVGTIMGVLAVLLYGGFWILVLLFLPFFVAQLLLEAGIAALVAYWKHSRGYPAEPRSVPRHQRMDLPWLRRYAFPIGFLLGTSYGLVSALQLQGLAG